MLQSTEQTQSLLPNLGKGIGHSRHQPCSALQMLIRPQTNATRDGPQVFLRQLQPSSEASQIGTPGGIFYIRIQNRELAPRGDGYHPITNLNRRPDAVKACMAQARFTISRRPPGSCTLHLAQIAG